MKNINFKTVAMAAMLTFAGLTAEAQIRTPQPSTAAKITQTVGLTDFTVSYSRPSLKGRKMFGEFLPYDKVWRTGANAATRISFTDDVKVEGNALAKGEYSIMSFPGKDSWVVVFSKDLNVSEQSYKPENDALRVTVKPTKLSENVETFVFNFTDITMNSANLEFAWEKTAVKVKIETEVDSKVEAQIKAAFEPAAGTYYQAASYYFDANKDMNKAYEWVSKAVNMTPKPQFWVVHLKAKIEAKLKKYTEAIVTAEQSITLAKEAGNTQYVEFNQKLIEECKKSK
jgi:hypothetical protein